MNILFLSRLFYPHIGGVEKHVFEISKQLVAQGHNVTIISEKTDDRLDVLTREQRMILNSFSLYYIPVSSEWSKKFTIWSWMWKHRSLITSADVIHCHDVFFWYLPFRFRYPLKKVFTTFHGYERYPLQRKAIMVRKLSELLSAGNICIGDFISKWYGTSPTIVSYGAVDMVDNPKSPKESSAVFFGRLDEQTGVLMYRDALLKIRQVYPHFSMRIVGDGKYRKNLSFVKGVTVEPFTADVIPMLQKHRFIFVSRYLSILEALIQKRLVFAVYDNPIKEDYLRMSPFAKYIYIAGNAAELAKQVISYIEDPVVGDKKVLDGYAFASTKSWEKLVNDYLFLWSGAKRKSR